MDTGVLQVRMLGEFSIRMGEREINDNDNRSKKVWLLLAYMIYYRSRSISNDELSDLLWGEEGSINPRSALKTTMHRVRTLLDRLGIDADCDLIVQHGRSYAWNPDVPVSLDAADFERLRSEGAAETDADARLNAYMEALALYNGDFLPKLSSEPWVVPILAYYHNTFLQTAMSVLPELRTRERHQEAVDLCRKAIKLDPYCETLYQHLMQNLLDLGEQPAAAAVYEDLSQLMTDTFGIRPSEETRILYQKAMSTVNNHAVSPGTVRDQLREPGDMGGALICDYDFFKVIYHAEARAVVRNGEAVHICLISVTGVKGKELPKRSLDCCMDNLQELIRLSLRKGDIASRCSVSQYILMLPQANYENSVKVCDRIVRAYSHRYPHSPAVLHYSVQALEPNE